MFIEWVLGLASQEFDMILDRYVDDMTHSRPQDSRAKKMQTPVEFPDGPLVQPIYFDGLANSEFAVCTYWVISHHQVPVSYNTQKPICEIVYDLITSGFTMHPYTNHDRQEILQLGFARILKTAKRCSNRESEVLLYELDLLILLAGRHYLATSFCDPWQATGEVYRTFLL